MLFNNLPLQQVFIFPSGDTCCLALKLQPLFSGCRTAPLISIYTFPPHLHWPCEPALNKQRLAARSHGSPAAGGGLFGQTTALVAATAAVGRRRQCERQENRQESKTKSDLQITGAVNITEAAVNQLGVPAPGVLVEERQRRDYFPLFLSSPTSPVPDRPNGLVGRRPPQPRDTRGSIPGRVLQ